MREGRREGGGERERRKEGERERESLCHLDSTQICHVRARVAGEEDIVGASGGSRE